MLQEIIQRPLKKILSDLVLNYLSYLFHEDVVINQHGFKNLSFLEWLLGCLIHLNLME